jgi:hypothetical protein
MMTEKHESFDLSAEPPPERAEPPPERLSASEWLEYLRDAEHARDAERVPDALEVATFEAARRQIRQAREMSRRDRYIRPANSRTARRRERSC